MQTIEADIAVIGAGIIGASCAYHCAKRGLKVALIDAGVPAGGTSGACDGYVAVSSKKPGLVMELALESKRLYPHLVRVLPRDVEYRETGGMLLVEDAADMDKLGAHVAALESIGVPVEFLDRRALREVEPNLSPALHGAFRCPIEAIVNPYLMTLALVEGAIAYGARTFWQTRPTAFDVVGSRIAAMMTGQLTLRAEQFVFAAGVWSEDLGRQVGVPLPVIPRRGELVVTARSKPLARHYLLSAKYLVAKADPEAARTSTDPRVRLGHGFAMEVNAHGQCIIGSTRSFVGHDRRTTPEGIAVILSEAVKRVPALAGVPVLRVFAGLRPYVDDKRPIIGRSGALSNLLVATGHEGDGICLSAITGHLIAELATGRRPSLDIGELSPDRFRTALAA
ncbi:MAG TPA: FAD-dependent oxidoreductase [Vicinamibacterales bacterium]